MKTVSCLLVLLALGAPAAAEELAPSALNSLSAPPAKLTSAAVLDQTGAVIGKVRGVASDQNGRLAAISYVASADNQVRVIAAPAASYDAQKNQVVADVSQARLGDVLALN